MSKSNEILTPKEASQLLGVSTKTLKRWSRSGKIKEHRLPSGYSRYYRSDLNKYTREKTKLSFAMFILMLWIYIKGVFK